MTGWLIDIGYRFAVRAFAPRPVVKKEQSLLVIQSGWRTALLTLGGRKRRVVIDPRSKLIRIQDRRFWVFTSRDAIEFSRIKEVIYGYRNWSESDWISHHTDDLYTVGLWLHSGQEVNLFKFYGEGEFVNNSIWPDWMLWDEFLVGKTAQHQMDSEALGVAEVISSLVAVPIGSGPAF